MKILLTILPIFLLTNLAIAEETIYPKDLSRFENFDKSGLEIIQKQYVDEGHQPWRYCPVYYARFFMNFFYPNLDPNERDKFPAELRLENEKDSIEIYSDGKERFLPWDEISEELKVGYNQAIVKVVYNDKEHTIYLHKAFPSNPESIWIVEKMIIKTTKASKNEPANFQGDWVYAGEGEIWFYLHLEQQGHKVKGGYSAVVGRYGRRIDGIPGETENVSGIIKGNVAEVTFESDWGGRGKAKIIHKGDKIEWLITEVLQRGYYCPNEATLLRDKKRRTSSSNE